MKRFLRVVSSLSLFFAYATHAQTNVPAFKHVVIIFQENRTPDNLFGAAPGIGTGCSTEHPFENGVDIVDGGPNKAASDHRKPYIYCLAQAPDLTGGGGLHAHDGKYIGYPYQGWVPQCNYDNTTKTCLMDGACLGTWPTCNQYQYVAKAAVQPYFDIATNYGFANYMFSTHEGPSFEGHQFIFGGSSAPDFPGSSNLCGSDNSPCYEWFVAENPSNKLGDQVGCPATNSGWPLWVDPDNNESNPTNLWCYDRNTLVTYQDSQGVHDWTASWSSTPQPAWKYYMPTETNDKNSAIWNAPEDDPQTCYFTSSGGGTACTSSEYTSHVSVADPSHSMKSAPILTDIQNCQLPAITWVIPDERWSDHPGDRNGYTGGWGPDWVTAIVNAIGQSYQNSNGKCDYWGYGNNSSNPEPTAIFITWDDWGGFYDHVPPPAVYQGDSATDQCLAQDAPNGWGCGYVYGFRVPLMVVSEWTPAGTISGKCGITGQPACPNFGQNNEYVHDFGSILRFTELNFTNQGLNLPPIAPTGFTYADVNSLDSQGGTVIPLWDFFQGPQRSFTKVNPIQYDASFFENYYYNNPSQPPIGPEDGDPMD